MAHTTGAAVKKPTEENTRERDLGVSVGRDSRYFMDRSMCALRFFYKEHGRRFCETLSLYAMSWSVSSLVSDSVHTTGCGPKYRQGHARGQQPTRSAL